MAAGAAQLSVHSRGSDRDRYCNLPKCRWQSTGVIPVPDHLQALSTSRYAWMWPTSVHIKSLKSPPPRHCSYHINQDRRPAMHEQQRHWNSRWVRPLSLKTRAPWYLEIKTICSIVFYRHPPTGQTNYRSPPIRQYNVLIIINNRRQSANRAYQVYEWIRPDAVCGGT